MQILLNEKETELWLEGKTEADNMRRKVEEFRENAAAVEGALKRVRKVVKEARGCHHDGTRDSCFDCLLYEDETTHDGTTWLMCASYRKMDGMIWKNTHSPGVENP